MVAPIEPAPARPGHAALAIETVSGESAVTSAFATSPLKLLTPRSRGRSVWACTSSFGGGLVAGDQTRLDLRLGAGARGFLGTQASTKIYRNPARLPSGHLTHATLDAGSLLVFAPDPVQAFAGSSYTQRQEFRLAADASLVLADWFSSGRAARGERWAFHRLASHNAVYRCRRRRQEAHSENAVKGPNHDAGAPSIARQGRSNHSQAEQCSALQPRHGDDSRCCVVDSPHVAGCESMELVFLDSIRLDPDDGPIDSPHRAGRFNCLATLLVLGPLVRDLAASLLADVAARPVDRRTTLVCSASPVRDGALLRVAGEQVEAVARELHAHLAALTSLLGDDPWGRKW